METEQPALDVGAVVDRSRIGGLHVLVAALGAAVLFVEGFDNQVIGYIAPQIARKWGLSHDVLTGVFISGLGGVFVGFLLLAPLAGRCGPRRVVFWSVLGIGLFTGLTTASRSAEALVLCRFLTGLALGGALPGAVALTGEFSPKRWRSTFITVAFIGISVGQIVSGLVANWLLRPVGWQAVVWVGAAVALGLGLLLWLLLPESVEYLVSRPDGRRPALALLERIQPGLAVSAGTRLVAGEHGRRSASASRLFRSRRAFGTAVIWIGMFMNLMVNNFVQNWLPTIFIDLHMSQSAAITTTTMTMWGGILAAFVTGPLMDRFGSYRVIAAVFVAGAGFFWAIGLAVAAPPLALGLLMALAFGEGLCTSSAQKGLSALAVHFYPTALRATGIGWALGAGRVGAILGPLATGLLLHLGWRAEGLFYVAALPLVCGAAAILAMSRVYRGDPHGDHPQHRRGKASGAAASPAGLGP